MGDAFPSGRCLDYFVTRLLACFGVAWFLAGSLIDSKLETHYFLRRHCQARYQFHLGPAWSLSTSPPEDPKVFCDHPPCRHITVHPLIPHRYIQRPQRPYRTSRIAALSIREENHAAFYDILKARVNIVRYLTIETISKPGIHDDSPVFSSVQVSVQHKGHHGGN